MRTLTAHIAAAAIGFGIAASALAQDLPAGDAPLSLEAVSVGGIQVTDLMDVEPTQAWPDPNPDNTYHSTICPPVDAKAIDRPDDAGGSVRVEWLPCPKEGAAIAEEFWVLRAESIDGPFTKIETIKAGTRIEKRERKGKDPQDTYVFDDQGLTDGKLYYYRVLARSGDRYAYAFTVGAEGPITAMGPAAAELQVVRDDARPAPSADWPVAAPTEVEARDKPNDAGKVIEVAWKPAAGIENVKGAVYRVYRALDGEAEYHYVGSVGAEKEMFEDNNDALATADNNGDRPAWRYIVAASDAAGLRQSFSDKTPEAATAKTQIVNTDEWNFLLFAVLLSAFILYFIQHIKSGKKLFVRKIAGLEAVEESIGRATEMGKPVLFIPGILDMNDVMTVAAIVILGRISRQVAEYDTRLMCPTSKSLVMTTGRETVKEAFISAGRPDAYNENIVTYLTDEQFGYVAGVNGIMVREKPATCLYFGAFFAESLILAETGNSIGAIQIAGTAQAAQLPFFIAACDYTLIGEELFAASAYLSHDPKQLGSLKGQDIGKLAGMAGIVLGSAFATVAGISAAPWATAVMEFVKTLFTPTAG